ncbi:MAG: chemotaxis protein CheW [Oscillatoriales cyanobacterium SM2_2_1]|nr:chemotaxis protein CheW [Oscillatoriales cyanobacterium SM2_2_1]
MNYLEFHLDAATPALLLGTDVAEVFTLRRNLINGVPQMPPCFLGVLGRRHHVYWVVDLPQLLGYPPAEESPQCHLILLAGDRPFVLTVPQIQGMISLEYEDLDPASAQIPCAIGTIRHQRHTYLLLAGSEIRNKVTETGTMEQTF